MPPIEANQVAKAMFDYKINLRPFYIWVWNFLLVVCHKPFYYLACKATRRIISSPLCGEIDDLHKSL
jgi:hypothetical protein